jgi:hypothetical protein
MAGISHSMGLGQPIQTKMQAITTMSGGLIAGERMPCESSSGVSPVTSIDMKFISGGHKASLLKPRRHFLIPTFPRTR